MIKYTFPITAFVTVLLLGVLIFSLPTPETEQTNSMDAGTSYFLKNVKLFDGTGVVEQTHILVENGLIAKIGIDIKQPPKAQLITGKELMVIPGLIDAHTHSYGSVLSDALRFGVTTHLDMFGPEQGLAANKVHRQKLNKTDRTDLFSAGTLATVEGGHGTQYGITVDTLVMPEDAEQWVKDRKANDADYIKLVYIPNQNRIPSLDLATAKAVIKSAHDQDLKALAHISTQQAAKEMIEAGIDGLVHMFADSEATEEFVALAKQTGVFFVPTLSVIASVDNADTSKFLSAQSISDPFLSMEQQGSLNASFGNEIHGFDLSIAMTNVGKLHQHGVPILAGSDVPNPGTAAGCSLHTELELLVHAGLSNIEALIAATSLPANYFQLDGRGKLAIGSRADLVILNQDAIADISATQNIHSVVKNGHLIERTLPETAETSVLEHTLLGDFELAEPATFKSLQGFSWSQTDDSIANGKSTAWVKRVDRDDVAESSSNSGALHVSGEVRAGFPYPWAGASVGSFAPPIKSYDISDLRTLSFDIKGQAGNYRVMLFSPDYKGIPPTLGFSVSENWQTISLTLADFPTINPKNFSGLAIVAGPQPGKFEYTLDNVRLN